MPCPFLNLHTHTHIYIFQTVTVTHGFPSQNGPLCHAFQTIIIFIRREGALTFPSPVPLWEDLCGRLVVLVEMVITSFGCKEAYVETRKRMQEKCVENNHSCVQVEYSFPLKN